MPTNMTVPDLVLRLVKGEALSATEMDANLEILRDFCNSLSDLLEQSLNTDGSLKASTVNAAALANRSVTQSKLASTALPAYLDVGGINALAITPNPALTAYEDRQVFFIVAAAANTAACSLNVNALGVKPLRKRGGLDLDSGDILAGQAICVLYRGTAAVPYFELIAGSASGGSVGSSGVGGGFSGFTTYAPADALMPVGPAYPYAFGAFLHGLAQQPTMTQVALVCVTPELGRVTGDVVPIHEVTDIGGDEAFTIQSSVTAITVTMNEAPCVRNTATGAITAITLASWSLRVFAAAIINAATVGFPALTYAAKYPKGAFANALDLFLAEERSTGDVVTTRINTTTSGVTLVTPAAGPYANHKAINCAPFKRASGLGEFIFTADTGIYRMSMAAPYAITRHDDLDSLVYVPLGVAGKPLQIIEDGGGALVQVLAAGFLNGVVDTISALYLLANVTYGAIAFGAVGATLDLRNALIKSADGTAGNVEFIGLTRVNEGIAGIQYNKLKKRLYVITADTLLLHIFEINDAGFAAPGSFVEWWQHANRYDRLLYKKTLAIAGSGDYSGNPYNEQYFIDHDVLTDGAERSIVFCRTGNAYGGSVTRVPWRE